MLLDTSAGIARKTDSFRPGQRYEVISEELIRHFYQELLHPGDTVLDVGVHFGIHLVPMAERVGPEGKVIGIEASKERFDAMSRKVAQKRLSQVTLHNVAASNAKGEARFFLNRSFTGRSGLVRNAKTKTDEIAEVTVDTVRLDQLLQDLSALRFMKLDIEGAEAAALAGAAGLLQRLKPIVIYEGRLESSLKKFPADPGEMRVILEDYTHYNMFGELLTPGKDASGWNFIAVPNQPDGTAAATTALVAAWEHVLQDEE